MMQPVQVIDDEGETTAKLQGNMTHKTYATLWLALSAINVAGKNLAVDCADVGEVDSSAVALLLALQRKLKLANKTLMVKTPPTSLKQLVSLYGLSS